MENNELLDDNLGNPNDLVITNDMKINLLETAKWGKFLSIVGFVSIAIMVLVGLFVSYFMNAMMAINPVTSDLPSGALGALSLVYAVMFILIAVIYIFPTLYLYRFSNAILKEKYGSDVSNYQTGFENLKSLFKFMGIITAILLSIYALIFLLTLFAGFLK